MRDSPLLSCLLSSMFFLLGAGMVNAQQWKKNWSSEELAPIIEKSENGAFSKNESEIFCLVNLVRKYPKKYLRVMVEPSENKVRDSQEKAFKGLIKELRSMKPVHILRSDPTLRRIVKEYAKIGEKTGKVGHGEMEEKYEHFLSNGVRVAENIQYGIMEPEEIVLDLLIDHYSDERQHRKNLLSRKLYFIGLAYHPHKKYGVHTVMGFSGKMDRLDRPMEND